MTDISLEVVIMVPDGTRICNIPEHELDGVSSACKWPMRDVALYHSLGLTQVDGNGEALDFQRVCDAWNAVCDLNLHLVGSPNAANIVSGAQPIDGAFGILGESYLPCGAQPNTQLSQTFDLGEQWDAEMLFQVVLHEVGHALGLEHAPQGTGAIMEPFLQRQLKVPQPWDIQQIVSRYGAKPATPSPTPTPAPTPAAGNSSTLTFPAIGTYQIQVVVGGRRIGSIGVHIPRAGTYPTQLTAIGR